MPEIIESRFCMDFDLLGKQVSLERSGNNKSKVYFSDSETEQFQLTNSEWIKKLGDTVFHLNELDDETGKAPTFRSLIAYFVRRQLSGAFTTPEKQATMQQVGDYQTALLFLTGLDWKIGRDWQSVRDREKTIEELKKAVGTGNLDGFIGKAADLRTKLTVSEARLKKLTEEVAQFRVLPQYAELEAEASATTRELNELANANSIDFSLIRDLESAMSSEESPSLTDLKSLYQEVGIVLPDNIQRRYEDVESFHESVIRNRQNYLVSELELAKTRIEYRNQKKAQLDQRRSEIMGILKSHGALEHFVQLQGEVGRLQAVVESLRQKFEAAEALEGTKNQLEIERNQLTLRLRRDFAEQKDRISEAILAFEETSQRLYESAGSIQFEETSNGPAFKFPMQGSRSKGIKNMQIFCFDLMLMRLCAKRGTGPGFLVHDSHLFDGVDGRQIISALKVGAEMAEELGFQYIVTLNEDDAFKETTPGFDLNQYVLPTRLTDATEDGGLFGIRF